MENWKQVVDYPLYEISNKGKIRKTDVKKGLVEVKISPAPIYLMFSATNDKHSGRLYVHREMLKAFAPSDNPRLTHVCFKDGDIYNTTLENLYWSTQTSRMRRRFKEGGYARGENHHKAKLNDQMVRDMKAMWASEEYSQVEIARKFGIHWSTLNNILSGRYWTHIK